MFLLLLLPALAGSTATRCVASLETPVPGCSIGDEIVAEARGPTPRAAERRAIKRLDQLTRLAATDLVARDLVDPEAVVRCDAAPLDPTVACEADVAATDGDFCFVTFDDPSCWDGGVLTVEYGGWRAVVDGRRQMCEAVDARQVRLNYRDLDQRRERCQASCLTQAIVRCPPSR